MVCKTCTPRPEVASQPAKKKVRRYFNTKWQISRPWLQYANGVMSCLACKEYPQPGVQQTWLTGNAQLRELTVRERSNCGVHCTSLALWESGGASTTVIGGLPEPVRNAIAGLFQLVYRMAKRGSPPAHIPGDAEAVQLAGGTVTPSYQSHHSVATITHAIAAPIRSVEGEAIESSNFFALASDSGACICGVAGICVAVQENIQSPTGNNSIHPEPTTNKQQPSRAHQE